MYNVCPPLKMFNSFCARHSRQGENMAVKEKIKRDLHNDIMIFNRGLKDMRTDLNGWEGGLRLT